MRPERDLVLGDRYVLNRPIATGGMGEVWEGTDRLLSRQVAVKVLKDELRTVPGFIERFRAEARHAGGLRHSGIATVFDYGETGEVAYLVMELVPGQPLSDLLGDQPGLPTEAKLSILVQTAEALHAAHRAGVVHRDVKPANLIVGPDGAVKVTDFGIARAVGAASVTEAGQVVGTAHYMSPEQATGQPATSASDIYALGVIAFEMFAGRRPFEADTPLAVSMAHVHAAVPGLPADVPRGVADLIRDSLSKDPSARPPSAEAFALRARREMRDARHATLRIPVATTVTAVQPSLAHRGRARLEMDDEDEDRRSVVAPLLASLAVLLLIASAVWLFAVREEPDRPAENDSVAAAGSAAADPPPTSPETAAPATATPVTAAPSSAAPSTSAAASTTITVAVTTTAPPVAVTTAAPPATVAVVTAPPTTNPPVTNPPTTVPPAAPAQMVGPDPAPIGEEEALSFVGTYYQQISDGQFDATWPSLTQEFRDARRLTFESYARYWRNTAIELGELSYVPGPGPDEARVRFPARYTTSRGVIEETDELTLRREQDGRLVITEQRIVS